MKPTARLVQGALLAASLGPLTVATQRFPSRQITIVIIASPLIALFRGGQADLLPRLFRQIVTPEGRSLSVSPTLESQR